MAEKYPTDEELKRIAEWDISKNGIDGLLELIESIWWCPEYGYGFAEGKLQLHTLGWSGNEDIIAALQANFIFWSIYWKSSERGGHYFFEIKGLRDD